MNENSSIVAAIVAFVDVGLAMMFFFAKQLLVNKGVNIIKRDN